MTQSCGPFCCHPQCWRSTSLEEKDITVFSDTSRKHAFSASSACPKLTVQTFAKEVRTGETTAENRLPQLHLKLMKIAEQRMPIISESLNSNLAPEAPPISFAEMQLCFENNRCDSFDTPFYKWIGKAEPPKADLYSDFFPNENSRVIHTVNILQQALPSRKKPRSGLAPPRASIKARGFFRPNRSPDSNRDNDLYGDLPNEDLMNLIASSKNILSPRETPLPAEQAYKKYASTMLPKMTRSESLQTVLQRNEVDSRTSSAASSAKSRRRSRPIGIPLTTLTLRLEGDHSKVATVTDRQVSVPASQYHQNLLHEKKSTSPSRVDDTLCRIFSGLSTRARQGSMKPSTASTIREIREQNQRPPSPVSVEWVDDPLGYLSARQSIPENVSDLSDRGTDKSLHFSSHVDSVTGSVLETASDNGQKLSIPTVEQVMQMDSSRMSPESAAQTARAPPTSPLTVDDVSARSLAEQEERPSSPPWLGLFVYESAEGSLASTRAPSVTKRGSPISGMSSALSWPQKEITILPLLGDAKGE